MMNLKIAGSAIALATSSFVVCVKAQKPNIQPPASYARVLNACVQNHAETLPNPFSDVPSNHWATKAVMTMYYCGAFRQATAPSLLKQQQPSQNLQSPNQSMEGR